MTISALARKLQVKPGFKVALVNPPSGYADRLAPLPEGATVAKRLGRDLDMVQVFVKDAAELNRVVERSVAAVKPGGLLWICYLKGGKRAGTDLNRDILWAAMELRNLVGVTLVSVDDAWSAMRFRPIEDVGK